ncbi:hypothetical protein CCYA_CCYA08G2453 [Cyanidiococcus yangmingshanensis]|nr:hypothetical protein CCYA_CCYA08G2453 [Cyanidiococcus yangmingshanensis]
MSRALQVDDSEAPLLLCRLQSGRALVEALTSLQAAASPCSDLVLVVVPRNRNGLRFVIQEFGYFQACVTLPRELFTAFECRTSGESAEETAFQVPRTELLTSLRLLISSVGQAEKSALFAPLRLLYRSRASPLQLLLQSDSTSYLECEVQTLADVPIYDFGFLQVPVYNDAVISGRLLATCFAELEYAGARSALITMMPYPRQGLRLEAVGDATGAHLTIEVPHSTAEDDSAIEPSTFLEFESIQEQCVSYSVHLLKRCLKALQSADIVRIRMNANDVLHLTARMPLSLGLGSKHSSSRDAHAVLEAALAVVEGASYSSESCFFEFLVAPAVVNNAQSDSSVATHGGLPAY